MTYLKKLLVLEVLALTVTGVFNQAGWGIWALEVFPAVLGTILILATYRKFQFSNFVYTILFLHSLILMYGGIYTYALTPLGDYVSEIFGWTRNNYDKLGHLMQGVTPVLAFREFFLQKNIVSSKGWLGFIVVSISLALAAFYEFIEWWVSLATGSVGDAFLGTQGYVWDTQSDMLMCLVGSILAIIFLTRIHDRSILKSKLNR